MDETVADDFVLRRGRQIGQRMASFAAVDVTASWVGAYDITPDWNPVLGPAPGVGGLTLAFGFSGHGFKLAPAVGLVLAQNILGRRTAVGLGPYGIGRFAAGKAFKGGLRSRLDLLNPRSSGLELRGSGSETLWCGDPWRP